MIKKTVKFLTSFILLCIFALTLLACDDKKSGHYETIIVGLDDEFPPMGFRDNQNKLVGFDIDLATELSQRLNIKFKFKPINWSSKEVELHFGRVDVLWNGLTITDYRKNNMDFTSPYLVNHQIIIVKNKSEISKKLDLTNKIIGVQNDSSANDAVKNDTISNTLKEIKLYADNVTALLDLANGRIDAVVVDEIVGRYYLAKKENEFKILTDHFGEEEYGVGVKKNNQALLNIIEKELENMKRDGTYTTIYKKWFGE